MVTKSRHDVQQEAESRYVFDFELCTAAKGYAQIDTACDAWYYGHWVSPRRRQLVIYAEGDLTVIDCETDEELTNEVREIVRFHHEQNSWKGIDAATDALRLQCVAAGLGAWLHRRADDPQETPGDAAASTPVDTGPGPRQGVAAR